MVHLESRAKGSGRIVDEDADTAERLLRDDHEMADLMLVAYVGMEERGPAARVRDQTDSPPSACVVNVGHHHGCAKARETHGNRTSTAGAARARDDGGAISQFHRCIMPIGRASRMVDEPTSTVSEPRKWRCTSRTTIHSKPMSLGFAGAVDLCRRV
jgi:hypothetical protein